MRIGVIAIAAGFLLSGCSSPAKKAEQEFDIVSKSGSKADICAAARKVEAAWLAEQDQWNYDVWKSRADSECLSAELDARR